MQNAPLVSILIPSYNSRFFEQALHSALNQTYANIEVIVSDDSDDGHAQTICNKQANPKLSYLKSQQRRGFHGNFAFCFEQAQGTYIKFLNHDDVLAPECVATMVKAFEVMGSATTLVTSRRQIINAEGLVQPDLDTTLPFSSKDVAMPGIYLGDHVLSKGINVIGEPSSVLFRKADVDINSGSLFCIAARHYVCFADVCLWLRLLAKGKAVYLANTLSYFRVHDAQLQSSASGATQCLIDRIHLPIDARALGFLKDEARFQSTISAGLTLMKQYRHMPGMTDDDHADMTAAIALAESILQNE